MAETNQPKSDLLREMAQAFVMDINEFVAAVKQQCFKDGACSTAQLLMLLSVAHKYDLNPLVRELHAFIGKSGKMEIVVGLDGWFKIAARDTRYAGRKLTENHDDKGNLISITCLTYRRDWQVPDEYNAVMDEWFQVAKPGKPPTNWEEMPRHRLQGVAIKEGIRRVLGITEGIGPEDERKIEESEAREIGDVIHQPGPKEPPALEPQPAVAADFIKIVDAKEKAPVPAGHLRIKLDSTAEKIEGLGQSDSLSGSARPPTVPSTVDGPSPSQGEGGSQSQGRDNATGAGSVNEHNEPEPVAAQTLEATPGARRRGRPRKVDAVAQQQAAGLEVIDPNERALETFMRVNDDAPTRRRLEMQLAKFGAAGIADLATEDEAKILKMFQA